MANFNSTIADRVVDAKDSGKEAKFIFDGVTYEFTPQGLAAFIGAFFATEAFEVDTIEATTSVETAALTTTGVVIMADLPTADPLVAGQLWADTGVLTVSAGV